MRRHYIGNTFSPMMLGKFVDASVEEVSLDFVKNNVTDGFLLPEFTSCVSHEVTSKVLTIMLGCRIPFNRINVSLEGGDRMFVVIPNFRADVAREFTFDEVTSAGYRCFLVICK
jgi:hypothetical protein